MDGDAKMEILQAFLGKKKNYVNGFTKEGKKRSKIAIIIFWSGCKGNT